MKITYCDIVKIRGYPHEIGVYEKFSNGSYGGQSGAEYFEFSETDILEVVGKDEEHLQYAIKNGYYVIK